MGNQGTAARVGTHERKGSSMTTRTLFVGLLVAAVFTAAPAWAFTPTELQILDCATGQADDNNVCGPTGRNTGPGIEQAVHALTRQTDGKQYLTIVYMTSKVSRADRPYQGACTSILLDPVRGPTIVADKVQLTANDGNRPFNHPALASNGEYMVLLYGTNDPNETNVATYAQAIDHMCNILTADRVKVSNDDNNNSAAPAVAFIGGNTWGGGYYVNGANQTHAIALQVTRNGNAVDITETQDTVVVDPTNIGRPTVAPAGPDRMMICASQGNERPPEDGIRCALYDTAAGQAVWSELIMRADNDSTPKKRYNTPQLASLPNNRFLVQFEQTNARGRDGDNNRQRGQTMTHVLPLVVDNAANNVTIENDVANIGLNQVHGTICTGNWGTQSGGTGASGGTGIEPMAAIFDASITGSGVAAAKMVKFDLTARAVVPMGNPLAVGTQSGDGGYLSNIYGQNPNDQGREFLSCLGNVPNGGYHVQNGFRPDVKSFFVFTYGGMIPPGIKNSGFTSFYPAEVDTPVPPVQFPLKVNVAGNGAGRVSSSPIGIACTQMACTASYDQNVVITLTAAPSAGSKFDGWSGDCAGNAQCVVRIDQARQVTATFSQIQGTQAPVAIFVAYDGDGHGAISSTPAGLSCNGSCNANFQQGAIVTLNAAPDSSSKFLGWSGDCTGIADCSVTLDAEKHVTARFVASVSGGGIATQDPRGPDPRIGNGQGSNPGNNPGTPAQAKNQATSVCSTTGNNSGALAPSLLVLGFIALIRRRRSRS
jgi:MYXO-CTERM domain-containing protein